VDRLKPVIIILAVIFVLGGTASVEAGEISPILTEQIAAATAETPIRAMVFLRDQVDIRSLDQELREANASLAERHLTVITTLQAKAKQTQAGLLSQLAAEKAAGRVSAYSGHWLVNAVLVEGTPEALISVSQHVDVEYLSADLVYGGNVATEKSISVAKSVAAAPVPGNGVSNPLRTMGVVDVWHELGINGTGQIIGIMDSGVEGTHHALSATWRGNTAPATECWLDLQDTGSPDFPVDIWIYGTMAAGPLVGHADGDTIGVAPGAQWIASNHNQQYVGDQWDANVITSLEFMADPDGNPATMDDVPGVVLNAWGLNESITRYEDCDSRWWAAMDACEAAGPVLIFAAGDSWYFAEIWSPADYAATETSGFSVGATQYYEPFSIWDYSSMGPSGCGGEWQTKPEVVAPGVATWTTYVDDGWASFSSSRMSAAHVAGVVALMRQVAPNADAETIKQGLLTAAVDLNYPGDDNMSGRGFVNAYAAVMAVMENLGTIGGSVTDLGSGLPVAGAKLALNGSAMVLTTDAAGDWSRDLQDNSYTFDVSAPGYYDEQLVVVVTEGVVTVADQALSPRPVYQVSGIVTGPDSQPLANAEILSMNQGLTSAFSDSTGAYTMMLPGGADLTHHLIVWGPYEGHVIADFPLNANLDLDFALPVTMQENFETGDLDRFDWAITAGPDWIVDETDPGTGQFSLHTPELISGQTTRAVLSYYAAEAGEVSFDLRVRNWAGPDIFTFTLDGDLKGSWAGDLPWATITFPLTQGHHVLEWEHHMTSDGYRMPTVWLDDINLPPTAAEPLAAIRMDVQAIDETVNIEGSGDAVFRIGNAGNHPLDITIRTATAGKAAGGPDSWGYSWIDSDEAGGPVYNWVDILADGTATGLGNEDVAVEVDLGFPFTLYGNIYYELAISPNGFVSFVSEVAAYFNRAIPNIADPNAFVAPFWDDLNAETGSGEVYWLQDPVNGRFIVTWENVDHDGTSTPETFQLILNADGSIDFQYALVNSPGSCTVGIENTDGTDGLQVAWNDATYLHSDLAIHFSPVQALSWVSCDPWYARIEPGVIETVNVHFDAAGLLPGSYPGLLQIASNDRQAGEQTVALNLVVIDPSGISAELPRTLVFYGAVPNPFNPRTELRFMLPTEARVSLNIYDLRGRRINSLVSGWMSSGPQTVVWNGENDQGQAVSSGRYFARLEVDGITHVKSMTLVR